jgi:hypothetical protein
MIFDEAIKEMDRSGLTQSNPRNFLDYCKKFNLKPGRTAEHISIDSLDKLSKELKENQCMVFRLGSISGEKGTRFGLAKTINSWEDYFITDKNVFNKDSIKTFIPNCSHRKLFPFSLMETLTETSLVNLSITSGLLGHALNLDSDELSSAPATGRSTFTFNFQPTPKSGKVWSHENGQIEIDSLFVSRRNGEEKLFVIEAKVGTKFSTLAKHKLAYPGMALQKTIPDHLELIPVYLKVIRTEDQKRFIFHVSECRFKQAKQDPIAISDLSPTNNTSSWEVRI